MAYLDYTGLGYFKGKIDATLGAEVSDLKSATTEKIDEVAITYGLNATYSGLTIKENNGSLVVYGTPTQARRYLPLNGQASGITTTGAFQRTLEAGTYYVDTVISGYSRVFKWQYTYTNFTSANAKSLVNNEHPSEIVTFTAPVMIGFYFDQNNNFGTSSNPTTVTLTIKKLTAIDEVARKASSSGVYSALDKQYLSIAYSKVNNISDAAINSVEHYSYIASLDNKVFNCIKGDARVTSDNKIIMCHDAGFTFDGNGRITTYDSSNKTLIHNMTYAECMAKEYAAQWDGAYPKVCDFETYIAICKSCGKMAFLVLRDEYIADIAELLVTAIKTVSMQNNIIVHSSAIESLQTVATVDPNLMFSLLIENGALVGSDINKITAFNNPVLTLYDFGGGRPGFTTLETYKTSGLLDKAISSGVRLFEAICYLDGLDVTLTDFKLNCLKYGIVGAQIAGLKSGEIT